MKQLLFLSVLLFGALSQAIAAEPAVPASFVADATTGISRAAFDTIQRFYKQQRFPPGELSPSKEYPVRIAFSESAATDVTLERTYRSATVSGTASIVQHVQLAVDDTDPAANKSRTENPDVWGEIVAARLRVKSGKYECAGTFLANGKKVVIISGDAEITGLDGPVAFSTGAQVMVDGQNFTYLQGKWVAFTAAVSDAKK